MMNDMATGKLRLKPGAFDTRKLKVNRNKLSQMGLVSYPTVLRYAKSDPDLKEFKGDVLYTMLSIGLGMSDEEIEQLKLGDLFEVVVVEEDGR